MTHDRDGPTSNPNAFAMTLAKSSAEALCRADWLRWLSVTDETDEDDDDDLDFVDAQPDDNSTVVVGEMPGTVSGPPLAEALSQAEIADAYAKGEDPWARCDGVERVSRSGRTRPSEITMAVGLSMFMNSGNDIEGIFRPGGITNVICASTATTGVLQDVLRAVTDHWQKRILNQKKGPDLRIQTFDARSKDRARALREFKMKVESGLRNHAPVVVISSQARQLPVSLESLTRRTVRWPGLTAEMIIETLRLTHSTTGTLAEREIRTRLPGPVALKRLEPAQIDAAFEEPTTLKVVDRLAEIADASLGPNAVTLEAVRGLGEVRDHLDRMLYDLQSWQEGQLPWSNVASSVVFHGPPGTGKTMLAKAIAGSAGIPLISTSYAECQKAGHQGEMLAALSAAFEKAAQAAPAVLFIDEIDSFSDRGGDASNRSYMRGVVNGLLEQINHAAEVEGLILLGATNHLDAIDAAVIRSGRFDLKLHIPYPDRTGIEAILAASLGREVANQLDLRSVSDRLVGQSGAAAQALARDALGRARAEKSGLRQKHLMQAADHLAPALSASMQRRIAIHEAGARAGDISVPITNPETGAADCAGWYGRAESVASSHARTDAGPTSGLVGRAGR